MPTPQRAAPTPIDRAEALAHLARQPILRPLGQPALATLLDHASLRLLRPRQRLFAAGDAGSAAYLVLSGWIKLACPGSAGRDIVLDLAGPGALFGELAVLCNLPRAADATALAPTRILGIDGRSLLAALRASPDALLETIRLLGQRLSHATAQMAETQLQAEPRLARALLRLASLAATGPAIDLGLSQAELGDLTGLTRESINKLLATWREAGIITTDGRTLTLTNTTAIRDLAGGTS